MRRGRTKKQNARRPDARAKRAERRAAWGERFARARPWALCALAACALAALGERAYDYAHSGSAFAIDAIVIEGAERTARAEVLRQARIAPGVNLFGVDPELAAGALEGLAWVERAEVERRAPSSIVVRLVERRPTALVPWNDELWVTDERGRAVVALGPADRPWELAARLPLVTGADLGAPEGSAVGEALEALEAWNGAVEGAGRRAVQAHLDPEIGVSIVTSAGVEVRLGRGRWAERARRFERAETELARRGVEPDYALVDGEGPLEQIAIGPRPARRGDD